MNLKIEYVHPSELIPYDGNARKHGDADIAGIKASIQEFGFNDPIGIWKDNIVIEGHGRLIAAKELGMEKVPVIRLDELTDEQRRAYTLAHNKTAELSAWDFEMLEKELSNIDIDMSEFGFEIQQAEYDSFEEQDRIFKERMAAGELSEDSEEYQEFLQKFEAKKTTDDCYTPDNIYNAVRDWAVETYGLKGFNVIRPFYPGGDYQKEDYSGKCVVIDNPPFSILSDICKWYSEHGVKYFLFANALTLIGTNRGMENYVAANVTIMYENGAFVATSFVTNMGDTKLWACPELNRIIRRENEINMRKAHKDLPKYKYPVEVVTSQMLGYLACHDTELKIGNYVHFIRALDSQKDQGKGLYGSGFLISAKTAVKKAAAEKAAAEIWELSEREKEIVKNLDLLKE